MRVYCVTTRCKALFDDLLWLESDLEALLLLWVLLLSYCAVIRNACRLHGITALFISLAALALPAAFVVERAAPDGTIQDVEAQAVWPKRSGCSKSSRCELKTADLPFDYEDMRAEIPAFREAYLRRPSANNPNGVSIFHGFFLWCLVRRLQPATIIESGALHGVGTWLLREAAGPTAQMIVITPELPSVYVDRHQSSRYLVGTTFRDFSNIDWELCFPKLDRRRTLVFFDDHQSGYRRVLEAAARGFRHLVFDDNYLPGTGDNFSPMAACDAASGSQLRAALPRRNRSTRGNATVRTNKPAQLLDNFGRSSHRLTAEELTRLGDSFRRVTAEYHEAPPLWAGPTRFPPVASCLLRQPVLTPAEARDLRRQLTHTSFVTALLQGLGGRPALRSMHDEARGFTFMAYVRLAGHSEAAAAAAYWPSHSAQLGALRSPGKANRSCATWNGRGKGRAAIAERVIGREKV